MSKITLSNDIIKDIIIDYNNIVSTKKISKKYKVSISYLYSHFKLWKLDTRDNSENKRKYFCNQDYFETIDSKDKAYFLGLIMADGCVSKNSLIISLQEKDFSILTIFKRYINSNNILGFRDIKKNNKNNQNQKFIQINSKKLTLDLAKYGVIERKTHFTYFPDIPEEFHSHFIRGVFDGDGCITRNVKNIETNNNQLSIFSISGNIILIEKIQEILMKECNLNKTKLDCRHKDKKDSVSTRYGGNASLVKIREYLYRDSEDLFLTRKKEKFDEIKVCTKFQNCQICNLSKIEGTCKFCPRCAKKEWYLKNKLIK